MDESDKLHSEDRLKQAALQGAGRVSGPIAAAMVAAGVGVFLFGLLTALTEGLVAVESMLSIYPPLGPLSGKLLIALGGWLLAWLFLHLGWKRRSPNLRTAFSVLLLLALSGLLLMFPPFYELFS